MNELEKLPYEGWYKQDRISLHPTDNLESNEMKSLMNLCVILSLGASTAVFGQNAAEELGDWVSPEDLVTIQGYVDSGIPEFSYNDANCPRYSWRNADFMDRLGLDAYGRAICGKHIPLPGDLLGKVYQMARSQLKNESDYDSRITKLYVLKQDEFRPTYVSVRGVAILQTMFNIPAGQAENPIFSALTSADEFQEFNGLHIGEDYVDDTGFATFMKELMAGQGAILKVSTGDGVSLYPGGGISVTHVFYISKDYVVYVKRVWWDA